MGLQQKSKCIICYSVYQRITYLDMSCKDGQYPHQMQSHQQNFALLQLEMDSRHAYFQNSLIVHHLACKVVSMENLESVGCGIFGFCLLSFPQNERKIYKLRRLRLSQFVFFFEGIVFTFQFWMIKFTIMSKKSIWHFHHSKSEK